MACDRKSAPWVMTGVVLGLLGSAACGDSGQGAGDDPAAASAGRGGAGGATGGSDPSGAGMSGVDGSAGSTGSAGGDIAEEALAPIAWDDPPLGSLAPGDLLGQRTLEMIETHCGRCHGQYDGVEPPRGATDAGLTLRVLLDKGWIVPGSSGDSPAFRALTMAHAGTPTSLLPVPGDVELLARFVDGLIPEAPECDLLPFQSADQALAAMAADVSALPADVRPFTRYLGLTYASNAGLCGAALSRQRLALFEAVNALSLGPAIVLPHAIDDAGLIYRIDLRDYAWDRGIDRDDDGNSDVTDAWQALVEAAEPYAAAYQGPDADVVSTETTTSVPFLPANAALHAGLTSSLYPPLLGIGADMQTHREALGVGPHPVFAERTTDVKWAAFVGHQRQEELVVRAQIPSPERGYWMSQVQEPDDAESIFDAFFDDNSPSAYHITFGLPNGLTAYTVERRDGTRAEAAKIHCSYCDELAVGAANCGVCHSGGILAVRDQVRDYVSANQVSFDSESYDAVMTYYTPAVELDAIIAADSALHHAALEQLGISADRPDPLSRVYHQFELDAIGRRRAAAELGVTVDVLLAALDRLPGELAPLGENGSIDRAVFSAAFAGAACQLHAGSRNRPASCP